MSNINHIQPAITAGSPLAQTVVTCELCQKVQVHAIGEDNGVFWMECLECNGVQSFRSGSNLLRHIKASIPRGGAQIGAIIMR